MKKILYIIFCAPALFAMETKNEQKMLQNYFIVFMRRTLMIYPEIEQLKPGVHNPCPNNVVRFFDPTYQTLLTYGRKELDALDSVSLKEEIEQYQGTIQTNFNFLVLGYCIGTELSLENKSKKSKQLTAELQRFIEIYCYHYPDAAN